MDWDALGAIAETLGAVGVILTLIYLATQIKQNTRSLRAAAFQTNTQAINHVNSLVLSDPDVARLFLAAEDGALDELAALDQLRFQYGILYLFRIWEQAHYLRTHGISEQEEWQRQEVSLRRMLASRFARAWWQRGSFGFEPGFRRYVEGVIAEIEQRKKTAAP